jgi:phosphoribosylformimino-5-aminoimidazole carboxamide ribonucleotide (ProFAR) isomerase
VPFTLLAAIDVAEGRLAVYTPEGPRPLDAFGGDPLEAAAAYVAAGVRWVHVVDMDRAFGRPSGADVTAALRAAHPGLRIEVSGGISGASEVRSALAAGADRVVLASAVLVDEATTRAALAAAGPAGLVGIEVEDGRIRGRRGGAELDLDLSSTLGWLGASRPPGFLATGVGRVGALTGPDVDLVRRVARTGRPTLAAGGIRSLEDLRAVREAGASGAVVGRAALEGALDLAEALAWAAT